jgi:hypothetical protein
VYYRSHVSGCEKYLHRSIWIHHHGPIPSRHDIHHVDGNPFNNDPSNLQCIESTKHKIKHGRSFAETSPEVLSLNLEKAREAAKAWHRSKEGRAWH